MNEVVLDILIGIITGVVSSDLFLVYFLSRRRAKIEISSYISKVTFEGQINYFFKFVNKTNSEIFDIRVEPTFYKVIEKNIEGEVIKLKNNFISYIPSKNKNDANSMHAMRVRTTEDLELNWNDSSSYIRLTVIARHSLSGLTDIFVKDFYSKEAITTKNFKSGDDLDVA